MLHIYSIQPSVSNRHIYRETYIFAGGYTVEYGRYTDIGTYKKTTQSNVFFSGAVRSGRPRCFGEDVLVLYIERMINIIAWKPGNRSSQILLTWTQWETCHKIVGSGKRYMRLWGIFCEWLYIWYRSINVADLRVPAPRPALHLELRECRSRRRSRRTINPFFAWDT